MTTRVDTEEISSTRSEKVLAFILAIFLLVGTVWMYVKINDWAHEVKPDPIMTAAEQTAVDAPERAWQVVTDADFELQDARTRYEAATSEERDAALASYEKAQRKLKDATAAADAAEKKSQETYQAYEKRIRDENRGRELAVAVIRLAFIAGWTFASIVVIGRMRRRDSRYLPLGLAAAGTGAVMALVYLIDYILDYIDPLDLGPFVLSALGVAASIAAFVVLQRHLARRVPGRRVRKGECPFCGFPVRDDSPHCEGCGREVIGSCTSCGHARRVGSPHCGACGSA